MAKKETKVISYIHIDEYLLTRPELREEVKAGFRVFMKGRSYQYCREDFDKEVRNYLTRGEE